MKSIRSRIMLGMLILVLFASIFLCVVFTVYLRSTLSNSAEKSLALFVQQTAENFNLKIENYINEFSTVAKSSDFVSAESDSDKLDVAEETLAEETEYAEFAIYSSSGSLIESSGSLASEIISEDDIKKAAEKSEPTLAGVAQYEGTEYFAVIVPTTTETGTKELAAAVINTNGVNQLLTEDAKPFSGRVFVTDTDGNIVFSAVTDSLGYGQNPIELAETAGDYEDFGNAVSAVVNGGTEAMEYSINDDEYVHSGESSDYLGLIVQVSMPGNTFQNTSTVANVFIFTVPLILFGITLVYAALYARNISKPIVSTTARLRKLAQGDLSTRVDVWYSKDELGILSNSLEETVICLRQYINLIQIALQAIADGNLTHRMEGNFKGDFVKIKQTFNEIFEALSDTFDSINHSAEQVTSGAIQVSNTAQALSQGATQQASAIEELSATLNNISEQVVNNSKNAKDAYHIVNANSQAISGFNEDMANMLKAMNLINKTSKEIANIIDVIDEISFQTNILALNAAVEAAREGSKSFGVVADEVRQLASRSAEAAKQTASLIERSADAVDKGSGIAAETANSLSSIVASSEDIQALVKEIADASAEQSDAILQINTGVDQISAVVASNTSTAVGSASASEELSSQALILKNMIARFRLTEKDVDGAVGHSVADFDDDDDDEVVPPPIMDDDDEDISINIDDDDDKY